MNRNNPIQPIPTRRATSKSMVPARNNSIRGNSVNTSLVTNNIHNKNAPKNLTFYVGKGNNEELIRKVMACRPCWTESEDSTSTFINLKWQQDQKGIRYNRLIDSLQYRSVVNHMEHHEALSNKEFLFKNIERYCLKNDVDLWKIIPPTFVLNCGSQCCMQTLKLFFDFYIKHIPKHLKERSTSTKLDKEIYEERRKLRAFFFNSNLKKILPPNPPMEDVYVNNEEGDYLWIVKPTFLNRGRGIEVFSKLSQFTKFVTENVHGYIEKKLRDNETSEKKIAVDYIKRNSQAAKHQLTPQQKMNSPIFRKQANSDGEEQIFDGNQFIRVIPNAPSLIKTDSFLLQKYLQKPLLIKQRKFDIRIWVLVTHTLKCYVFPQGYIRLSSSPYSCKDSKDGNFVHLTNNSVQKFSAEYGKVSAGNQMSFDDLREVMQEKNLSFVRCKQKIFSHIICSLNSTIHKLNSEKRKFSFEIFGYDFMVDQKGDPWLIEVNNNPCLEESSPLLKCLLPRMLDDAFKLTIDLLFFGSVSSGNFPVKGYESSNLWMCLPISS